MRHSKKMVGDYRYSCKVLTHVVRLNDGHVMPDWIDVKNDNEAKAVRKCLDAGEYDNDKHAIRTRRSPKDRHHIDVKLDETAGGFWQSWVYKAGRPI